MIISHRHKFIFLKPQKVAGTSVEVALAQHCGADDIVTSISAFNPHWDEDRYTHPGKEWAGYDRRASRWEKLEAILDESRPSEEESQDSRLELGPKHPEDGRRHRTKELVAKMYHRHLEHFGYRFDQP